MSQHNITGSEVFGPKPFVMMRSVRPGAFRKRRAARTWAVFMAGAVVAVVGGAVAIAAVFGPEVLAAAPPL